MCSARTRSRGPSAELTGHMPGTSRSDHKLMEGRDTLVDLVVG